MEASVSKHNCTSLNYCQFRPYGVAGGLGARYGSVEAEKKKIVSV